MLNELRKQMAVTGESLVSAARERLWESKEPTTGLPGRVEGSLGQRAVTERCNTLQNKLQVLYCVTAHCNNTANTVCEIGLVWVTWYRCKYYTILYYTTIEYCENTEKNTAYCNNITQTLFENFSVTAHCNSSTMLLLPVTVLLKVYEKYSVTML